MSKKWTKWYLLIGSALGIMCCTLGCISIAKFFSTKNPTEKFPIQTLSIQVDQKQREELFDQLRKFSAKHNLEFHLSRYEYENVFLVEMYGEKFHVLAQPIPRSPEKIDIDIYEQDPENPPSQETIDKLFDDLKKFISEIPGVKIIEEK